MTREEAANILDPEIDIQYLFDFIREHYGKRGVDSALLCECVDAEACRMGAEALRALDAQEKSKTVSEWISVKDRLPEPGRYVACIAKRNPFSRFMPMVARIEKNGWANPITEQYISEVTHWMPLPEPPKEEKR